MSDRFARIETLYHAARPLAAAERAVYLANACGDDVALRCEVESLLAQDGEGVLTSVVARPALATGTVIGAYRIVEQIGVGGMGEVYRAHDTKLGRDVALKVLPPALASDRDRLARLEREARLLASLNHANIAHVYGLEESNGARALVMELIEGGTLADRIARRPVPLDETLPIARQIASALAVAHDHVIIHRDLKPANIKLRPDGTVKVLDFGLAKNMDAMIGPAATKQGAILGTPSYMSPEQARGLPVDKRTDIWAFGCVLFEMLTGRLAFGGATVTDTLARILDTEPDWTKLPAQTPASIRTLLERCLRKDPHKRLRDVGDALMEIESASTNGADSIPSAPRTARERFAWIAAAVLAVALIVVTLLYIRSGSSPPAEPVELTVAPANGSLYTGDSSDFAISPDGRHLAFAASKQGVSMLWVRSLSTSELRVLPGTEGGRLPFWKHDSQALGFFANGQLKTVRLNGGSPVILCGTAGESGGTWGTHDVIVFSNGNEALKQIGANSVGGNPTPATVLGATDARHRWPEFFPDGDRFLYLSQGKGPDELRVGFLSGAPSVSLGPTESHGVYAAGYLFFIRGGNLVAQHFDANTLKPKGEPVSIAIQAGVDAPWQRGMFSVSPSGNLAYNRTARISRELTWLDRHGTPIGTAGAGVYFNMDLSRDETHLAISRMTERPGTAAQFNIWIIDLTRANALTRLTDDPATDFDPSWSPDGLRVVFNSNRPDPGKSPFKLFVRAANGGSRDDELLPVDAGDQVSSPDWSRDGRFIVYTRRQARTDSNPDLWTYELKGDGKSRSFLSTPDAEQNGVFSPDVKWIAYESNTSGRLEVYVRPFPAQEGSFQISLDGGWGPRWRGDGKELFFLSPDGMMMSATIDTAKGFVAGVPRKLFPTRLRASNKAYAVSKDGQRFLIPQIGPGTPITVVLNWPALLPK